ncbi:MAG: TadG family pilus assembly protein [Pigmentiphaga sp.]|uniref:TadG family pilus assembly protein n=1 Tax=Pigmentiphaga sp. TaxID=1977564 RepID=UPI0029B78540|nr:TadG family pilus assembly protein [Pigmentiphaga sp.]MDX3907745.1 TadG family pilus assembly protein [Pigmentiphaga sp.]
MTRHRRSSPFVSDSRPPLANQRGSVLIAAAAAMLVSVILLASADLGYLFYMKREFQKTADLAALAGAQQLERDSCAAAAAAAVGNANLNLQRYGLTMDPSPAPACGRWDPNPDPAKNTVLAMEPPTESYGGSGGQKYFGTPRGTVGFNAVKVVITQSAPPLLPFFGERKIHVEAIATREASVASFTVGSRLVRLYPGSLLYNLLETVGVAPSQLDVLSSAGLANVSLTPAGLLKALGLPATAILDVGTPNEAAALKNLKLGELLQAMIDVLSLDQVAGVQVAALQALHAELRAISSNSPLDLPVRLFGTATEPGVFAHITTPSPLSALNATVNVLDLLGTSISVANGDNLISIPDLNVAGLVRGKIRIVEPPTIAIGGIGTTANSAQIRVYLRVGTTSVPLVGGLLNQLGTVVDLPIILEVAQSTGTLQDMCSPSLQEREARLSVQSSVANLCLGSFPNMGTPQTDDFFSATNACTSLVGRHKVLDVLGLLPVRAQVNAPLLPSGTSEVVATAPVPPAEPEVITVTPDDNIDLTQLGHTVASAIGNGLLGDVLGAPGASGVSGASDPATKTEMAYRLLGGAPSPGFAGRSLTEINAELTWSGQALQDFANTWSSGAVLTGLLQLVGKLLGTVGAVLGDVVVGVCGIAGGSALYQCKLPFVISMINGDSAVTAILGMVVQILSPLLDALSSLLQGLLNNVLGLGLGETDLSLLSVDCGNARLVY